ncbi:MAG: hypothetical protein P3A32_00525 [Gemmatimonadota bacterium]|jgi:hypothetical protein|nr:hypothetical protein [Gemmatimonadota bacterium]MDQ8146361.1 hypothetical protein [Gemmatimonadota bacterium]MDQ8148297.1 hypothetical protein [Gemmatimonadota bacterium]MDQ8155869.1 hypothetical protein [Gemmatimonadota bacterium]MDQ8175834.1 hypothetical protein [Gemmatimonadota bacterium]
MRRAPLVFPGDAAQIPEGRADRRRGTPARRARAADVVLLRS